MKKGFTLVEIIISISIIAIIGTTTALLIFNNKSNKNIEIITKKVLESASIYIDTEVDDYGNTYKTGILSGGKGVQLSVQNLVDKGYVTEDDIEMLDDEPSNLYILAALTTSDESLCGEGNIQYTVSWDTTSDAPVYLCGEGNIQYTVSWDTTSDEPVYLCRYKENEKK